MWSQQLAQSYSNVGMLSQAGLISADEAAKLTRLGEQFKVRITPYYASLMSGAADCPIRLQAIPALGEEDPTLPPWATEWSQRIYGRPVPWSADAIGDVEKLAAPRLTHRYENRAILHLSTLCAVYCRFCFRKSHLNERESSLYEGSLDPAFTYLTAHTEIRELILTGGDPLSLTDAHLEKVLERVATIPHIRVLRFHSRMAVTLPERLTSELAEIFARPRANPDLSIRLVSHFNHPRELTIEARTGLRRMRLGGVALYNQSVLLAGINSDDHTLIELFQRLYECGVTPMYLHHPDWTPGTFHFRTSIAHGQRLSQVMRGKLPGPAIPHYVLDLPQGHGKALLGGATLASVDQSQMGPIQGVVYDLAVPTTRATSADPSAPRTIRYLDLHPST